MEEWDVARSRGQCSQCASELAPGDAFYAVLVEAGGELERRDYCTACWVEPPAGHFCFWKSRIPTPEKKHDKGQLVDDSVLVNFFERLEQQTEPIRVRFRFVLALILMRKKLLRYEQTFERDGVEYWQMRLVSADAVHEVENPRMTDEQITEVSSQLGAILRGGSSGDEGSSSDEPAPGDGADAGRDTPTEREEPGADAVWQERSAQ